VELLGAERVYGGGLRAHHWCVYVERRLHYISLTVVLCPSNLHHRGWYTSNSKLFSKLLLVAPKPSLLKLDVCGKQIVYRVTPNDQFESLQEACKRTCQG